MAYKTYIHIRSLSETFRFNVSSLPFHPYFADISFLVDN